MLIWIIDEIEKSIENECYIAALALALTIPDICGKAEFPHEKSTSARYIRWYNEYVGKYEKPANPEGQDMPYESGEIVYNLRNSLLHQGNPSIEPKKVKEESCKVDRFKLSISTPFDGGYSMVAYGLGCEITERVLEINIVNLCHKLCATAKGYYNENNEKFDFFDYEINDKRLPDEDTYLFGGNK